MRSRTTTSRSVEMTWVARAMSLVFVGGFFGLMSCTLDLSGPCVEENRPTEIDVSGVFRYRVGDPLDFSIPMLSGTITFTQDGDTVRVVDTTYDFAQDRALEGEAQLEGNKLVIRLVPKNGDTDYIADIIFLFSEDGSEFCVEFSDTNDDTGALGSFVGARVR